MKTVFATIIIISALAVGIIFLAVESVRDSEQSDEFINNDPVGEDFGVSANLTPPVTTGLNRISVSGTQGRSVTVNNIQKLHETVTFDGENYKFADNSLNEAGYEILFHAPDESFLISLESPPLKQARIAAEAELLEKLGISETDACQLTIRVATSLRVSETFGAKELGLSFCPGSIDL
ncbi:MAG: hypothetical protein AAGA35_01610 [Patescibacteria group bacterium]